MQETKQAWDAAPKALTPADELFFCLAFDATKSDPDVLAVLRRKDTFTRNPFCWITNPGDVAEPDNTKPLPPDFAPLFTGQRAVLMECLQTDLAKRWIRLLVMTTYTQMHAAHNPRSPVCVTHRHQHAANSRVNCSYHHRSGTPGPCTPDGLEPWWIAPWPRSRQAPIHRLLAALSFP